MDYTLDQPPLTLKLRVLADMRNPLDRRKFYVNKPQLSNVIGNIWEIQAKSTKISNKK